MMQVIEPQFQRDFISLLPKEVRKGCQLAPRTGTTPKQCPAGRGLTPPQAAVLA